MSKLHERSASGPSVHVDAEALSKFLAWQGLQPLEPRLMLSATLEGSVFGDRDRDGFHDTSDADLAGWRVFIDANTNDKLDAGERSILTGPDGSYRFDGLAAGAHRIRAVAPEGWDAIEATGLGRQVEVGNDEVVSDIDFGFTPDVKIVLHEAGKGGRAKLSLSTEAFDEPNWAVDWGDGAEEQLSGGRVKGDHVYAGEGLRSVKVTVTAEGLGTFTLDGPQLRSEPKIALSGTGNGKDEDLVLSIGYDGVDADALRRIVVDWGDGTTTELRADRGADLAKVQALAHAGTTQLSHRYTDGDFEHQVRVWVTDADGTVETTGRAHAKFPALLTPPAEKKHRPEREKVSDSGTGTIVFQLDPGAAYGAKELLVKDLWGPGLGKLVLTTEALGDTKAAGSQGGVVAYLERHNGQRTQLLRSATSMLLAVGKPVTVAVSWDDDFVKLFINGELVDVTAAHRLAHDEAIDQAGDEDQTITEVDVRDASGIKQLRYFTASLTDAQVTSISSSPQRLVESQAFFSTLLDDCGPGGVDLEENTDFVAEHRYDVTIEEGQDAIALKFCDLFLDPDSQNRIKDAFEIALVDAQGNPLTTKTIGQGRDAFFNWSEGQEEPIFIDGVGYEAGEDPANGVVSVDVSHLVAGTVATVVVRLVNNDGDTDSAVHIHTDQATAAIHHVLWGVEEDDAQLFAIWDYGQPTESYVDFGLVHVRDGSNNLVAIGSLLEAFTVDSDGFAYAIANKTVLSHSGPVLLKIDLNTVDPSQPVEATIVGTVTASGAVAGDKITGLAVQPGTGDLYALFQKSGSNSTDRVLILNKTTAAVTAEREGLMGVDTDAIVIQAESGALTSPMQTGTASDAYGGGYVFTPAATAPSLNSPPATGIASYTFEVADAGSYELWVRAVATSSTDDSFWVRVDGGTWIKWNGVERNGVWEWQQVENTDASGQNLVASLSTGQHTVEIAYREAGAKIDALAWSKVGKLFGLPALGSVEIEGESGTVTSPMQTASDSLASGGSYVQVAPGNNSTANPPATGKVSYTFSVDEAADYHVWARTIAATTSDDTFWVRMDGGSWFKWDLAESTQWTWGKITDNTASPATVASFSLSAGSHTLEIAYSEDGAKLDKLVVTRQTWFTNTATSPDQKVTQGEDLAFSADGKLWVSDRTTTSLVEVDPATGRITKLVDETPLPGVGDGFDQMEAMAFDPVTGDLVTVNNIGGSNSGPEELWTRTSAGVSTRRFYTEPLGLTDPEGWGFMTTQRELPTRQALWLTDEDDGHLVAYWNATAGTDSRFDEGAVFLTSGVTNYALNDGLGGMAIDAGGMAYFVHEGAIAGTSYTGVKLLRYDLNSVTDGGPVIATYVGNIGVAAGEHVRNIAFDPSTGTLYGVVSDDVINTAGKLITINPATGAIASTIGELREPSPATGYVENSAGFAISTDGTTLFVSERSDGKVYTIDKTTAAITAFDTTPFAGLAQDATQRILALTYNPVTQTLWGSDPSLDRLIQVTPGNGGNTELFTTGGAGDVNVQGAAFHPDVELGGETSEPITPPPTGPGQGTAIQDARRVGIGPVDFTTLGDVTAAFGIEYTYTSHHDGADRLSANLELTRKQTAFMRDRLLLVVANISNPGVTLADPDGFTPEGLPYYDITGLTTRDPRGVITDASIDNATLRFLNPDAEQFTYDLVLLSNRNQAPRFLGEVPTEVAAGNVYTYDAEAEDPDDDAPLTYSLVTGPAGLTIDEDTGLVTWDTGGVSPITPGGYTYTIRVTDPYGAFNDRAVSVAVLSDMPNRPPRFTTTPVVDAYVADPMKTAADSKVVVANDEWILTDTGFANAPSTAQFARNIASYFTGGAPGKFLLAYSIGQSVVGSDFAETLENAGHEWDALPSGQITADLLAQYDGMFVGGRPLDNQVLIDYVEGGGNVYLFGGSGTSGDFGDDPAAEAAAWASFLDHLGLSFETTWNNISGGAVPISGNHPLLAGVSSLYQAVGQTVDDADNADSAGRLLLNLQGGGMLAVYDGKRKVAPSYIYDADAADADGDTLQYTLQEAPDGMLIDAVTGVITWEPTANQIGTHSVTIVVSDGNGGEDIQTFNIRVHPQRDNSPPAIVSEPVTKIVKSAPDAGNVAIYDAEAIDADQDTLEWSLVESGEEVLSLSNGITIDPVTGVLTWAATQQVTGSHPITLRVEDGRGGFDEQAYELEVVTPALGEIRGAKFYDLDGDGTRDEVGRVIVAHDVNTLASQFGGVQEQQLAINAAEWLIGSSTGSILAIESHPTDGSRDISSDVQSAWTTAGFDVTISSSFNYSLQELQAFDVLYVGMDYATGDAPLAELLYDYVQSGGNLYVVGGVDSSLDHIQWVPFLEKLGLAFGVGHQTYSGYAPITSTHPIFDGITELGAENGNEIIDLDISETRTQVVETAYGMGIFAVASVPERGVEDWIIYLDENDNGRRDAGERWTTTNANGDYSFTGLPLGTYIVREEPKAGWVQTAPVPDAHTVTLTEASPQILSLEDSALAAYGSAIPGHLTADQGVQLATVDIPDPIVLGSDISVANRDNFFQILPAGSTGSKHGYVYGGGPRDVLFTFNEAVSAASITTDAAEWVDPGADIVRLIALSENPDGTFEVLDIDEALDDLSVAATLSVTSDRPITHVIFQATTEHEAFRDLTFTPIPLAVDRDFGNRPTEPEQNLPPVFETSAPTAVRTHHSYRYDARATDPENDEVTYDLPAAPIGMAVDSKTGVVVWSPTAEQLGPHQVVLRATDALGNTKLQPFTIVVSPNRPPTVTAQPASATRFDNTNAATPVYEYQVIASDPDGDDISYELINPVAGMTISAAGLVTFDPPALGTYPIRIAVRDEFGAQTIQSFDLRVYNAATNAPPVIHADGRLIAYAGKQFSLPVTATDPDGDSVTLTMTAAPAGATYNEPGYLVPDLIRWTPQAGDVGQTVSFTFEASDGINPPVTQVIQVQVERVLANQAPNIVPQDTYGATVGESYYIDWDAIDPEGDYLTWRLAAGPDGMTLDEQTGELIFTPIERQIGTHYVEIHAIDAYGKFGGVRFDLPVRGVNTPPKVETDPVTLAVEGEPYEYELVVSDAEGDPITFTYDDNPATNPNWPSWLTATPSGSTLALTGTPPVGAPAGPHRIEVEISDGEFTVTHWYDLYVATPAAENEPPRIVVTGPPHAHVGVPAVYDIVASDPDGDTPLTFDVDSATLPEGPGAGELDITDVQYDAVKQQWTAKLRWTPQSNQVATHVITVSADDGNGAVAQQIVTLPVHTGNADYTISVPSTANIVKGGTLRLDVLVEDAENDPVQFELIPQTPGDPVPSIDEDGRITWDTTDIAAQSYAYTVRTRDAYGREKTAPLTINVLADTTDPVVVVRTSNSGPQVGETITLTVSARDDARVAARWVKINGTTELQVADDGTVQYTVTSTTDLNVVGYAQDVNGNEGQSSTLRIEPFDDLDPLPEVSLAAVSADGVVSSRIQLVGTVQDKNSPSSGYAAARYRVELIDLSPGSSGSDPIILAPGEQTGLVNNAGLGVTLDPTLLADGDYLLRLVATDQSSFDGTTRVSVSEQRITIDSDTLKLGNFSVGFTDLSIPVAGVPITITRTYDSLNAHRQGDFGHGWTFGYADARIDVSGLDGQSTGFGEHPALTDDTILRITLPGGREQVFQFAPQRQSAFTPYYVPAFVPVPGTGTTSTLEVAGLTSDGDEILLQKVGDGWAYAGSAENYNPASSNFGGAYRLTTRDGTTYDIDAGTPGSVGAIAFITDRNGNELQFTGDRVVARNAANVITATVEIHRDHLGRIDRITDPAGKSIVYTYDLNGDLASVTNREGETTTFTYNKDENGASIGRPHFLTRITDHRGVRVLQAQFGADNDPNPDLRGRLIGLTDASGNTAPFSYSFDLGNGLSVEQVADATPGGGVPTEVVRDSRGNVLRRLQRSSDNNTPGNAADDVWVVSVFEYDADDRQTVAWQAFEASGGGSARYTDAPVVKQSESTYDDAGNLTSVTDALGNVTRYGNYDAFGNPRHITDPLGNTTASTYDETTGRLTETLVKDHTGNVLTRTTYAYDASGNLTGVTQYDGDRAVELSANAYDAAGRLTSTTDQSGQTRYFAYDSLGRQTHSWHIWTDPNNSSAHKTIASVTTYDDEGRVTATAQHVLAGSITGEAALIAALLSSTPLSTSSTTYTATGQVASSTDRFGTVSYSLYDTRGNLVESRTQAKASGGGIVWSVTRTFYDANGRAVATTDPFIVSNPHAPDHPDFDPADDALQIPGADLRVTHTIYDDLGRVVETRRVAGVAITIEEDGDFTEPQYATDFNLSYSSGAILSTQETHYDAQGRVDFTVAHPGTADELVTRYEYDAAGRQTKVYQDLDDDGSPDAGSDLITTYTYDAAGRQKTVTDAKGHTTTFQYDALGRATKTIFHDGTFTTTAYDALGRRVSETDQLGRTTTYEYDDQGRLTGVALPQVADPEDSNELKSPSYAYGFDDYGNQTAIEDAKGRVTGFTYDHLGRQVTRTLPKGVLTTGDPLDFTERMFYDDTPVSELGGSASSSAAAGQLAFSIDFEGRITQYLYDNTAGSNGRLVEKRYFTSVAVPANMTAGQLAALLALETPAKTVEYAYDAFGRAVETVDSVEGAWSYGYDAEGRRTQITHEQGSATVSEVNYEYDSRTGQLKRTYTADTDTRYTYDNLGRLKHVVVYERNNAAPTVNTRTVDWFGQNITGEVTEYGYDLNGNLDWVEQSNGVVADYQYDALNRLELLVHFADDVDGDHFFDDGVDSEVKARYDYELNLDGSRKKVTETDDQGHVTVIEWKYDAAGRLVSEAYDSQSDDTLDYITVYELDLVGNRLQKRSDTDPSAGDLTAFRDSGALTADETITYAYDENDRLLTEVKDASGTADDTHTAYEYGPTDQTKKTVKRGLTPGGTKKEETTFAYNTQGRLSGAMITSYDTDGTTVLSSGTTAYAYDDSGIRISQTVDGVITRYVIDPSGGHTGYAQVLEERDASGNLVKTYTIGLDVIAQAAAAALAGLDAGEAATLLYDGHGSTRALLDSAAAAVQRYAYDAYGNMLTGVGLTAAASALTTHLYAGEQFDHRTGLGYNRARYYDPRTGRFNRVDPWAGNAADPQSLHKYLYTHSNPVMGTDPTGFAEFSLLGITVTVSIKTFLVGTLVSYALGKAVSAGVLLATEGSLQNFRWFEWMDLLAFVPGGVVTGILSKVRVLPVGLLTRVGGTVVGKYFGAGLTATVDAFKTAFSSAGAKLIAADGTEIILEAGTRKFGFQHILQRHLAQFWDGTKEAVTTFFPTGATASDVIAMLKEAVAKADPNIIRSIRGAIPQGAEEFFPTNQVVELANGLSVRLVTFYKDGVFKVLTFYPEAGPGITKAAEVVGKV